MLPNCRLTLDLRYADLGIFENISIWMNFNKEAIYTISI